MKIIFPLHVSHNFTATQMLIGGSDDSAKCWCIVSCGQDTESTSHSLFAHLFSLAFSDPPVRFCWPTRGVSLPSLCWCKRIMGSTASARSLGVISLISITIAQREGCTISCVRGGMRMCASGEHQQQINSTLKQHHSARVCGN